MPAAFGDDTIGSMGLPSYDEATLSQYFMGVAQELMDDVSVGPVLRRLAATYPDVLTAVADVDRSQIRDAARLTPMERLAAATAHWNALARLRGHG